MYSITFDVWAWKDIMRTCGSVIDMESPREMLHYIKLSFDCAERFKALSSNGYQVSIIEGKCCVTGYDVPFDVLLMPQKTPPKTKTVELKAYDEAPGFPGKLVHNIAFYCYSDGRKVTTGQCTVPVANGEYANFEKLVIEPALDRIHKANHGTGDYMIAVNKHYLINALNGMDSDVVLFNFSSPVSPFLIRPYDEDAPDAMALVCPVRINA